MKLHLRDEMSKLFAYDQLLFFLFAFKNKSRIIISTLKTSLQKFTTETICRY